MGVYYQSSREFKSIFRFLSLAIYSMGPPDLSHAKIMRYNPKVALYDPGLKWNMDAPTLWTSGLLLLFIA